MPRRQRGGAGASSSSSGGGGGEQPEQTAGAEAAGEASLRVGAHVTISGLQARPELNGYGGVVVGWNEQRQRYMVELDGTGERLLLREPSLNPDGGRPSGGASAEERRRGQEALRLGERTIGGHYALMLESMWRVSLLDIEATLRRCNKVLSDQSVDKDMRRARARGWWYGPCLPVVRLG